MAILSLTFTKTLLRRNHAVSQCSHFKQFECGVHAAWLAEQSPYTCRQTALWKGSCTEHQILFPVRRW